MATQYLKFKGPCKWAKVYRPDDYQQYSICLYLDEENKEKYLKSGMRMQLREDEDGSFVQFKRAVSKLIKGQAVELGKPKTIDKAEKDFEDLIGNGSVVEVTVDVYDSMKGKGHTLRQVKVLEHVVYERKED